MYVFQFSDDFQSDTQTYSIAHETLSQNWKIHFSDLFISEKMVETCFKIFK